MNLNFFTRNDSINLLQREQGSYISLVRGAHESPFIRSLPHFCSIAGEEVPIY